MNDKTVIYYSSNRENPDFEAKIRANIIEHKGDLPLVSVTQKPFPDFGKNICVGDVGHSYLNMYRQMLLAAKEAKTAYVVLTEADTLYPENYFGFEPQGANVYRYNNTWILFKDKIYSFRRKAVSSAAFAMIAKRDYFIKILEDYLDGGPQWYNGRIQNKDKNGRYKKDTLSVPFETFGNENPCVSFKTGDAMRVHTNVMHGREYIRMKLPYWGHVADFRRNYL